jgi:hypothetical protein
LRGIFYFSSEALQIYEIFLLWQSAGERFFCVACSFVHRTSLRGGVAVFFIKKSLQAGYTARRAAKKMKSAFGE